MRQYHSSLAFLFILLLMYGCKEKDNPVDNTTPSVIMPIKTGNSWSFLDSTFNADGSFARVDTSRLVITGSVTLDFKGVNTEFFHWAWVNRTTNSSDFKWLVKLGDDGLSFYGGSSPKGNYLFQKSLSAKYPVQKNESWAHYSYSYYSDSTFRATDTVTYTCIATDSLIVTAMGGMRCVVYRYGNAPMFTYLCYAPDIGYVAYYRISNNIVIYKKSLYARTILPKSAINYSVKANRVPADGTIDPFTGK